MKNRSGSYKKVLFETDELAQKKDLIVTQIELILDLLNRHLISTAEFTALYLLLFLRLRNFKNYMQRHSHKNLDQSKSRLILDIIPAQFNLSELEIKKLHNVTFETFFTSFNLKGIPKSVNRSMENWLLNKWDIVLSFKIPNSYELLKLQTENKRVLTLIVDSKKVETHILGVRDPLSFAIHDLMHADQFFNNRESQIGQLGFYKFIYHQYKYSELQELCESNQVFNHEFEYVVSDMNAYIIHILKSFKSCFTRASAELTLKNILLEAKTPSEISELIMNLNISPLPIADELKLKNYFESLQGFYK